MAIVHISTSSALFFGKNMGRKAPQGVTPAHLLYGRQSNGDCNGNGTAGEGHGGRRGVDGTTAGRERGTLVGPARYHE